MRSVHCGLIRSRNFGSFHGGSSWRNVLLLITSHLGVAANLPLPARPMFKLQRVIESGIVKLIVIGRIDAAQLPDLQDLVLSESAHDVVLDLLEVTLVDSEVVRFLVQCETNGLRLANCPAYIREWMCRENGLR